MRRVIVLGSSQQGMRCGDPEIVRLILNIEVRASTGTPQRARAARQQFSTQAEGHGIR